ncbi:MAG: c-type cytochrome [Janthinobacterium lividum]
MNRFTIAVLFFFLGVVAVPVAAYFYLGHGHPPVAVADPSFPMEAAIVHNPLHARINRELPGASPVPVNDATLTEGAYLYKQQCAFCHGLPNHPAALASNMFPGAPQLWERHHGGAVVGVSDDPVGESYWKIKNGIRLSAMPSYVKLMSDQQMWELSNLVKNADKPLPQSAQNLLQADGSTSR